MSIPGLRLASPADRPLRVVAIGAHADDLEIGACGTIMRLIRSATAVDIHWIVLSAVGEREIEARRSADRLLGAAAAATVEIERFPERYFPFHAELKGWFDDLGRRLPAPDLVFGPCLDDAHQDHSAVARLIRQTFRRTPLILEYEIPKLEGDLGHPNLFVELPEAIVDAKLQHLEWAFPSQRQRTWFRRDVFRGLLAIRGVEGVASSGYAEAFVARKVAIDLPPLGDEGD